MLHAAVARSFSVGHAMFIYFRFCGCVDGVKFSYNGANALESKTTRMFRPVCQVAALGAKTAVSDHILFKFKENDIELTAFIIPCFCTCSSGRRKKVGVKKSWLATVAYARTAYLIDMD